MSYIKNYLENVSVEIGEEGAITPKVMVEAKKRIKKRVKVQMPDLDDDIYTVYFK